MSCQIKTRQPNWNGGSISFPLTLHQPEAPDAFSCWDSLNRVLAESMIAWIPCVPQERMTSSNKRAPGMTDSYQGKYRIELSDSIDISWPELAGRVLKINNQVDMIDKIKKKTQPSVKMPQSEKTKDLLFYFICYNELKFFNIPLTQSTSKSENYSEVKAQESENGLLYTIKTNFVLRIE